jgi:hypothetical protein
MSPRAQWVDQDGRPTNAFYRCILGLFEILGTNKAGTLVPDGSISNVKLALVPAQTLKGNAGIGPGQSQDLALADALGFVLGRLDIVQNGVDNPRLAKVPASTLKGNAAGVLATPADLSVAQVRALLGLGLPLTASLVGDVALNNVANYFDGPSVVQGATGTWFASGTVTLFDPALANMLVRLWDGTTVIASAELTVAAGAAGVVALSGVLAAPAGNLRISVQDLTSVNGKILFNISGNNKDSTLTAWQIAL